MSRRMWILAAAAWALVVVAGSALTWVAIDRAGQQVTGSPSAGETQPVVVGTIGAAPTKTPKPGHTASPTTVPPTTSSSATGPATQTPKPRPGRNGSPTKASSQAPTAQTETRTWSGAAGTVTVACTGRTAQLRGTSPSDGWHAEVGDTSGSEIEVKFEQNETEVQVKATCVDGVPRFQAESGSDSSDTSDD